MKKKIGPNDKCWCNSGRKFKHCHRDRHIMKPFSNDETLKVFRKAYGSKYCLHPEVNNCRGGIVKAHSVQKKLLYTIARDGKIYYIKPGYDELLKNEGSFIPVLEGVNRVSRFSGFCGYHDDSLFAGIEKDVFSLNEETAFLLSYRALARELFFKKCTIDLIPYDRQIDRGHPERFQEFLQHQADIHEEWMRGGLRDIEEYKKRYDEVLLSRDFSRCRYYCVETDPFPPFVCSGVTAAECEFNGEKIQDFQNRSKIYVPLTFTVIPKGDVGGMFLFAWLDDCQENKSLISSLHAIPDVELPEVLRIFAFEFFENKFFSPDWWEALPSIYRHRILNRTMEVIHPFFVRNCNCMLNDGLNYVSFKCVNRVTNVIV